MGELKFRQIHMDFHTSEKIPSVGEGFDAEEFAEVLDSARVNSVSCFARCHHGMLYYDSKRFPKLVHPGLKNKNLLLEQIDACHKRGIRVPVYTTIQWDYHMSRLHPDWCCMTADGGLVDSCEELINQIYEPGFYRTLCVNNPDYRQFLKDHIQDLFQALTPERIDGIFLDIVNVVDCSCQHCVDGMLKLGYDPTDKQDRTAYAVQMLKEFRLEMTAFIKNLKEDITIFYNGGHIGPVAVDAKDAFTHWELESLPSGDWGYTHFTNTVRYARTTGMDFLSHTGKFHTMWGDFHSFKNTEALQYECFRMLAYNSKCLIGDQLDPDGRISGPVYDLVKEVYQEVEKKEPWCTGAKAITDLAVLTDEWQVLKAQCGGSVSAPVNGACAMLDEMGYQFDIVDEKTDWNAYPVLILPDVIWFDDALAKKAEDYVAKGGKILATGKSGLDKQKTKFMLDCLGVKYIGEAPYNPDFIMPNDTIGKTLPKTEHVMYLQGEQVEEAGGTVVADTYIPYFNRTWQHFCSHRHTPSSHQKGYPAVIKNNDCIYFMHPLFSIYQDKHPKWCKEVFRDALELLLPEPAVRHSGPTTLTVTLNEQEADSRYVLHALHYIPIKNCAELYTIEDVIPLHNVQFSIKTQKQVKAVRLVPEGKSIAFEEKDGRIVFQVEKIDGHLMAELSY
uniref:Beta-galactosidase trimerisation domain-containing protein n=1 Tax=Eubacterium plexicaudatum ASF492 TaxID=1235802 RepID=N2BFR4_9FIRM